MTTEQLQGVTLVHGDNMEYLRSLPDKAFDIVIADPPYGDATQNGGGNRFGAGSTATSAQYNRFGGRFDKYKKKFRKGARAYNYAPGQTSAERGRLDAQVRGGQTLSASIDWDVAPPQEYFDELFRVSRHQIIWGANYFPNMPSTRCFVVWRKLSISEKFSMAMCEYAWTSFDRNAKVFECAPHGNPKAPRFHPTQKPVALYAWLISNFCEPGWRILDPNLGSGSSAIAAHNLGFELTGVEIDDVYYAKARERIAKYQQQLKLF